MTLEPQTRGNQFAREARIGLTIITILFGIFSWAAVRRFSTPAAPDPAHSLRAEGLARLANKKQKSSETFPATRTEQASTKSDLHRRSHQTIATQANTGGASQFQNKRAVIRTHTQPENKLRSPNFPINNRATRPVRKTFGTQNSPIQEPLAEPNIQYGSEAPAGDEPLPNVQYGKEVSAHEILNSIKPAIVSLPKPPQYAGSHTATMPNSTEQPTRHVILSSNQQPQTLVIESNDSFWSLSQRAYGTGHYCKALQEHYQASSVTNAELQAGATIDAPSRSILRQKYPHLVTCSEATETVTEIATSVPDRPTFESMFQKQAEEQVAATVSAENDSAYTPDFSPTVTPLPMPKEISNDTSTSAETEAHMSEASTAYDPSRDHEIAETAPGPLTNSGLSSQFQPPLQPAGTVTRIPPVDLTAIQNPGTESASQQNILSPPDTQLVVSVADSIKVNNELIQNVQTEQVYTVRGGENLFEIARSELRQASRYLEILKLNRNQLPHGANHLTKLSPGLQLKMPNN